MEKRILQKSQRKWGAALAFSLTVTLSIALSGCFSMEITPPVTKAGETCNFVAHSLSAQEKKWDKSIVDALENNPGDDMLFLSGGSQNGAFGAGFLKGWSDERGKHLPDFSVVTGVSTGALLSVAAFTDNAQAAVDSYRIEHEREVLDLFVKLPNGKMSPLDFVKALKAGAASDLTPMRKKLKQVLLTPYVPSRRASQPSIMRQSTMMEEIAKRGRLHKKLFAVVTSVDTGEAKAFDMTEMAIRISDTQDAAKANRLRDCFVSALLASSIVPLAAKPEFIDNTMYIDGGARFGIMNEMIGAKITPIGVAGIMKTVRPSAVYGIINGDQKVAETCGVCDNDPTTAHKDWNLIGLAERSLGVLTDQVYQFSENKIYVDNTYKRITSGFCTEMANAARQGYRMNARTKQTCESFNKYFPGFSQTAPQIFKIEKGAQTHQWEKTAGEEKTCEQWKQYDKDTLNPLQFHPNYMKCMISYGQARAKIAFARPSNVGILNASDSSGNVPQFPTKEELDALFLAK